MLALVSRSLPLPLPDASHNALPLYYLDPRLRSFLVGADVDGIYGEGTKRKVRQYQKRLGGITADGKWGPSTEERRAELRPKGDGACGPATIAALQRFLDVEVDGAFGPDTKKAMQRWLDVKADGKIGPRTFRALQDKVGAKVDGDWGSSTTRSLQKFLRRY